MFSPASLMVLLYYKDMANVNIENHRKRQKATFFDATRLDTSFMRNVSVFTIHPTKDYYY